MIIDFIFYIIFLFLFLLFYLFYMIINLWTRGCFYGVMKNELQLAGVNTNAQLNIPLDNNLGVNGLGLEDSFKLNLEANPEKWKKQGFTSQTIDLVKKVGLMSNLI